MSALAPRLAVGPGPAAGLRPAAAPIAVLLLMALAAWLLRLGLQAASGASLHVDEAQYWDWSRSLQWGYYSKPPVIAALIRASTTLFGDSETGLRALSMACHPAAAVVLGAWAADIARDSGHAARAAGWTAAIYLASPIAALLGLVATTDAPLMLCWAVALATLWQAVGRQRAAAWLPFGLACGIGLLSKYSAAALVAGAAAWVLWQGRPRDRRGFAAAIVLVTAMLVPHLLWNQDQGWPTWRHTAEITVDASRHAGAIGSRLGALLEFGAGQWLIAGPLVLLVAAWPGGGGRGESMPQAARRLLACTSLPIALAGVLQAFGGGAQINWILPVHLALAVGMGLRIAAAPLPRRRAATAALIGQLLLCSGLAVAPRLADAVQRPLPPALDVWARMRGWHQALQPLAARLAAEPPQPVVFGSRSAMAQAAYHLRGLGLRRAAWHEAGPPRHHYALTCPWAMAGPGGRQPVLFIGEGPAPPPADGSGRFEALAATAVGVNTGRSLALSLSRWHPAAGRLAPAPEPEPAAPDASWCR